MHAYGFRIFCELALVCVSPALLSGSAQAATPGDSRYILRSESSRPDMVSGDSVLIEVQAPRRALYVLKVLLNGRDVTAVFRVGKASLLGRVEGLTAGENMLEISDRGKRRATLDVINHTLSGPILSGPHQQPFVCRTDTAGLGSALDKDCTANTRVTYFYKSPGAQLTDQFDQFSDGTAKDVEDIWSTAEPDCNAGPYCHYFRRLGYKNYDPAGPRPADIEQVTTTEGHRVDFIVRRERGTLNRGIYDIYFLHQPGQPLPDPWRRTPGWNGRLVYAFGGGCGVGYQQGLPFPPPLTALSQGYAVATSSLNFPGMNCNDVTSAEAVAMVKEHFSKQFGPPVHTIGWGASGGSTHLYLIAQNYPGLLDGIIPYLSFPDILTTAIMATDCLLLDKVFKTSHLAWTEEQRTAVSGFESWSVCGRMSAEVSYWVIPSAVNEPKVVPHDLIYDRVKNPQGLRCTLFDNQINIWGRDRATGFARRPLDNVGMQYGLNAFNEGKISADQFLDVNERIGGLDADGEIGNSRTIASAEALRIAYQTGRVGGSGGLSSIPIIDARRYLDDQANVHDSVRSLIMRARLLKTNGHADNQVILTFPSSDKNLADLREPLRQMDDWLNHISNDRASGSDLEKTIRNKPAGLADACWTSEHPRIGEFRSYSKGGRCHDLYPPYGDVRLAAGMPLAEDVLKCVLKPLARDDYRQSLSDAQWQRLNEIFPQGVCDYSQPGVMQQPTGQLWQVY